MCDGISEPYHYQMVDLDLFTRWSGGACPPRLEWALAPDRGALGYQTGSLAARMAFGRLRGPWVQELKPSSPADCPWVVCGNVEAGGQSPGRVPGVTPWGLSVAC